MARQDSRILARHDLEEDGWTVIPVNRTFPDFLAIKGGKVKFVEVAGRNDQIVRTKEATIRKIKGVGVPVEIMSNGRQRHKRVVISVSVPESEVAYIEKLHQILKEENPPRTVSRWFRDQALELVSRRVG